MTLSDNGLDRDIVALSTSAGQLNIVPASAGAPSATDFRRWSPRPATSRRWPPRFTATRTSLGCLSSAG